jgi:glycosyltransferase involved in cell wall biosynthesis
MVTFVNRYLLSVASCLYPDACWKYRVVPNSIEVRPYPAVDAGRRRVLLDAVGVRSSSFVVSFTGNLREKKGPWTLLEAFRALREEFDASLLIIGRADGLSDFSKMVLKFPFCRDVHVLGSLPQERVRDYQEISDVAIFPSLDDGMANGLLESMERARPVVVSDVFSDVVHDQVDGFVCRRFEVSEFSAALCALARDPDLRIRVGERARQRVAEAFSPQYESLEYVRAYQTTVRPSLRSESYRGR